VVPYSPPCTAKASAPSTTTTTTSRFSSPPVLFAFDLLRPAAM
jgi:hypothetical protein